MIELTMARLPAPYTAYAYSYPHKSSYRPLTPPVRLREAWLGEDKDALSLYIHLPFCEMRCGFCNLFTLSRPQDDLVTLYLDALERQSAAVSAEIGAARIAQFALGGGTPTYLTVAQLARVFDIALRDWGVDSRLTATSVEVSPPTADHERLRLLRDRGVRRISIGVQSFVDAESRAMGRPQARQSVIAALERIRALEFPVLNVDLIYGANGQNVPSWLGSLHEALRFAPEEMYLYPLYVRPQTGLGRHGGSGSAHRLQLYAAGRDFLLERGYEQISMRCFRRPSRETEVSHDYCCQRDGMVGLGCGARSYTSRLHYSYPFAVEQSSIQSLITAWNAQTTDNFQTACHGVWINDEERRRRFVLLSLLQTEGLHLTEYDRDFAGSVFDHLPALCAWVEDGLAEVRHDRLLLTDLGLSLSDSLGPALYSPRVRQCLEEFVTP